MAAKFNNSCKQSNSQRRLYGLLRHDELLEQNQNGTLIEKEKLELTALRKESERFMLCKAQAVALLHWRGYRVSHS